MAESRPLSPQQVRYVEEFSKDSSSKTKAAIRAGYSIDTAKEQASRLSKDPRVVKLLKEAEQKAINIVGLTKARVLQELALIAFAKPGDVITTGSDGEATFDLHGLSKDNASGTEVNVNTISDGKDKKVMSVTVKTVKPADKIAALAKLGQHLGMFKDKLEVSGSLSLIELVEASMKDKEESVCL